MVQKQIPVLHIDSSKSGAPLGDLFGIFFEDLNHAADGGLYAELVQNRSFEFDPIDNPAYTALTAWEKVERNGGKVELSVENTVPLNPQNIHYAVVTVIATGIAGIANLGYNTGIPVQAGEAYLFSCFARNGEMKDRILRVAVEDPNGAVVAESSFVVSSQSWKRYEVTLSAHSTAFNGRLLLTSNTAGSFCLDMVSLFPAHTFKNRKNGMRRDIAELLSELKPKFMRFPGGCLVHDGSLNPDDRDSMYRWKNTIGPVESRPARRNNWKYNQTLGLGFYEYFLFCEDIGAKPLPVLPAGYNPHRQFIEPVEKLQPWIDDALDLIEFANGERNTRWGAKRAELGHSAPFNLEYIAIGNEEVADAFFERYAYFHNAIRSKYPEIKIINSASPFPAGSEFEKGWKSARENHSDFIDEHYYQSPEWFIAHYHRYDSYNPDDPKVFLGEYASWGNTWYNALVEAAYLTGLEKNARAVGLACYAPMLCNADYINWKPDLIWFNNHEVYGSSNYYVQKLFMRHQGTHLLQAFLEGVPETTVSRAPIPAMQGKLYLVSNLSEVRYYDITLTDRTTGAEQKIDSVSTGTENKKVLLGNFNYADFTLTMKAVKLSGLSQQSIWGGRGFEIDFGQTDEHNFLYWEIGGWQNQDATIYSKVNGSSSCLTQSLFAVETGREYSLTLQIKNRTITGSIDGKPVNHAEDMPCIIEPLYYSAAADAKTGNAIIKCINLKDESFPIQIDISTKERIPEKAQVYQMAGFKDEDANSFENKTRVIPTEFEITIPGAVFTYTLPGKSITIFSIY